MEESHKLRVLNNLKKINDDALRLGPLEEELKLEESKPEVDVEKISKLKAEVDRINTTQDFITALGMVLEAKKK